MSIVGLDHLFAPASVAVVGASPRPASVGGVVLRNLREGGFQGEIYPVNPRHRAIDGEPCWPSFAALPHTPDLAVICTPPHTVLEVLEDAGRRGIGGAAVITALRDGGDGSPSPAALLATAGRYGTRILGPNSVGLLVPGLGLNASFAHMAGRPGQIAFVSQSGALCTAVLDWATSRNIGFSHFISLGDALDVDFGDLVDYLGHRLETRALLLYIESIADARKFLSAARAVARNKPIVLVKAGRAPEGARAAASHTGAITGSDAVFEAAVRRAGVLRVASVDGLFEAVETLAVTGRRGAGPRLLIVTNGGGLGVLATDALVDAGGQLATLEPDAIARLDAVLPATWSRANPVDIIGDADAERYRLTLEAVADSRAYDAILVMLVPTAIIDNLAVAGAVAAFAGDCPLPLFAVWMGGTAVAAARQVFSAARVPDFETPTSAIRAFMQLVDYRIAQETLMETPPSVAPAHTTDRATATALIEGALGAGRAELTETEAKQLLAAYGIPVIETRLARTHAEAGAAAAAIGYPVVVKVHTAAISHKTDMGGVHLDIADEGALEAALRRIDLNVAHLRPDVVQHGYAVQRMARRGALELLLGVASDPVFGPAIAFGHGGTAVEVIRDTAVALPPLNVLLARNLIARTRVARLLAGYRDRPPADMRAIELALVQLSQLVVDYPQVQELDINPLLADHGGVVALDARVRLAATAESRLAISPYPNRLEERLELPGFGPLCLRPIRPEDEPAHGRFLDRVEAEDLQFRFFRATNKFTHELLAPFTQIDYDREMAFIATTTAPESEPETLAVARAVTDANNDTAEFAILVRSDLKGRGLGRRMLGKLVDYQRSRGTRRLVGYVLSHNNAMLRLCRDLHFDVATVGQDGVLTVSYDLQTARE